MTKKFIKDNRGQVLYAVIVTVMFMGVLSMIAMGLTLQHYHAAEQKQAHVTDYYAADAVAELIRIGQYENVKDQWSRVSVETNGNVHIITCGTATIETEIENYKFISWEVSYHAVEEKTTEADVQPAS